MGQDDRKDDSGGFGETVVRDKPGGKPSDDDLFGETVVRPEDLGESIEAGRLIAGRYRVVRELGRGGMGVVYLVQDSHLRDREVALKKIHPALIRHPEAERRFEDEVIISQELAHDNIVRVFSLERDDDDRFFTMEYLPGRSLREIIEERKAHGKPFSLTEAAMVIGQVLDALAYAHQQTIHRDIKPDNIMIQGDFPDVKVKVMDFGIAKALSPSRMTTTAQSMGTAYYMAPEQLAGAKNVTPASDLYSVGAVLYEMLTGKIPAGRFKLPGDIVPGLPPELDEILDRALKTELEDRFQDATQFQTALKPVTLAMESPPPPALPGEPEAEAAVQAPGPTEPVQTPSSRKSSKVKWWIAAALVVIVAAGGVAGVFWYRNYRAEQQRIAAQAARRRAEEAKQRRIDSLLVQARAASARGEHAQAVKMYQRVLAMDSANQAARKGVAEASAAQKRQLKISDLVKKAEKAMDDKKYAAARKTYLQALDLAKNHFVAKQGLARANRLLERQQQEVKRLVALAETAKNNKQWAAAKRYYEQALEEDPENDSVKAGLNDVKTTVDQIDNWLSSANDALNSNDPFKAWRLYKKALAEDPKNTDAASGLEKTRAKIKPQSIFHLIRFHKIENLGILLEAHPEAINLRNRQGQTPLIDASGRYWTSSRRCVVDIPTLLLARGADVTASDKKGRTALHWVAMSMNDASCRSLAALLINKGAKINALAKRSYITPLGLAVVHGNILMVRFLVSRGANVNLTNQGYLKPLGNARIDCPKKAKRNKRYCKAIAAYLKKHGASE